MAKTVKFEDKMKRLQEIVDLLDGDSNDISESIKLYEEGLKLSKELKKDLKSYEDKLENITKGQENE